jgi:hypothetical protein
MRFMYCESNVSVQHNFLRAYGRELPNAKTGSLLIYSLFRNRNRVGRNHQEDHVCQKWGGECLKVPWL